MGDGCDVFHLEKYRIGTESSLECLGRIHGARSTHVHSPMITHAHEVGSIDQIEGFEASKLQGPVHFPLPPNPHRLSKCNRRYANHFAANFGCMC